MNMTANSAPHWQPADSAVGVPDGTRKNGSTGQLFEAKNGQWQRVPWQRVPLEEAAALAEQLRSRAELFRMWHRFELGMTPPAAIDYLATGHFLDMAADMIDRLRGRSA